MRGRKLKMDKQENGVVSVSMVGALVEGAEKVVDLVEAVKGHPLIPEAGRELFHLLASLVVGLVEHHKSIEVAEVANAQAVTDVEHLERLAEKVGGAMPELVNNAVQAVLPAMVAEAVDKALKGE